MELTMATKQNIADALIQIMGNCYGTENYYINNYIHFKYTDGVITLFNDPVVSFGNTPFSVSQFCQWGIINVVKMIGTLM